MIITPSSIPNQLVSNDGTILQVYVLDIGAWDMLNVATVNIIVPMELHTIRVITPIIVRDDQIVYYFDPQGMASFVAAAVTGLAMYGQATAKVLTLSRSASGQFQNANFQSVLVNRGRVTILYVP